jgi:hypothetical protein
MVGHASHFGMMLDCIFQCFKPDDFSSFRTKPEKNKRKLIKDAAQPVLSESLFRELVDLLDGDGCKAANLRGQIVHSAWALGDTTETLMLIPGRVGEVACEISADDIAQLVQLYRTVNERVKCLLAEVYFAVDTAPAFLNMGFRMPDDRA